MGGLRAIAAARMSATYDSLGRWPGARVWEDRRNSLRPGITHRHVGSDQIEQFCCRSSFERHQFAITTTELQRKVMAIDDIDEHGIVELERVGLVVDEVAPAGRPTSGHGSGHHV
jgi:hypothetical protein